MILYMYEKYLTNLAAEILSENNIKQLKKKYIQILKKSLSSKEVESIKRMLFHLNILSTEKLRHSIRVSQNVLEYSNELDVILGALFHDYIERGGNIEDLPIDDESKDIVEFLTALDEDVDKSEGNSVLTHLKSVFSNISDQELKNKLVYIKISDRLDNLRKRGKNVSKNYLKKSIELMNFLWDNYVGSSIDFEKIIVKLKKMLADDKGNNSKNYRAAKSKRSKR